jgi:phage tail-like protein
MARKSFVIQKTTSEYGSYLQYPSSSEAASVSLWRGASYPARTDDDTRLKSNDLQLPPLLSDPLVAGELQGAIAFFEAEVDSYTQVTLSWGAPLSVVSSTVSATALLIVYSPFGEPPTISDGTLLVETSTDSTYTHAVPAGKWAYYSVFVKYESTAGDLYYEKASSLSVLTPKEYGGSLDLFKKVPLYYRLLDEEMDNGAGGPLKRFLSTFGFELDKTRTEIDFLMTCKDPEIANSYVLDVLADDLSVKIVSDELGPLRLRNILNSIGKLRRQTGTIEGIETFYTALTGSDVVVDTVNKKIKVYAQRVNLLKDPNITNGTAAGFDGGSPFTTSPVQIYDAGVAGTASVTATYSGGEPDSDAPVPSPGTDVFTDVFATTPLWVYEPDASSGGSISVLQTLNADVPVIYGDILYFSVQNELFQNASSNITKVALYKTAGYGTGSEVPVASTTSSIVSGGNQYWELVVDDTVTTYTNVFLAVFFKSNIVVETAFKRMLLERSINGEYFDGHTVLGGWLTDNIRVSDYRWYNPANPSSSIDGTAHQNFSVYNSNYQKTRNVAKRLLSTVLPVTELVTSGTVYSTQSIQSPRWEITYNHIPGVS